MRSAVDSSFYRIEISYAVFGVIVVGHTVTDAAPIAKWTIGKNIHDVIHWYRTRRGATITFLPQEPGPGHNPPQLPSLPKS